MYWSAFDRFVGQQQLQEHVLNSTFRFRRYPQVHTLTENIAFCHFLREILDEQ